MSADLTPLTFASTLGIAVGLAVLARGMASQRRASRIGDTATSTIRAVAAGEVRISGLVEAAELTLTSPLQSRPCIYYRSSVEETDGQWEHTVFDEERAVGFRLRDDGGEVRVFPRGARWAVPERYDERLGALDDEPTGLRLRSGGIYGPATFDRTTRIAELLTVHPPTEEPPGLTGGGLGAVNAAGLARRRYREARIEPGDVVTIVGLALPFDQLSDPEEADLAIDGGLDAAGGSGDPVVTADLEEARGSGALETDPDAAWGNAAIPGFGIGRPARAPELDPAARPLAVASEAESDEARRRVDIPPECLVVAAGSDVELLVSVGTPDAAVDREETRFLVGLLGAILAIASAVALATSLSGGVLS